MVDEKFLQDGTIIFVRSKEELEEITEAAKANGWRFIDHYRLPCGLRFHIDEDSTKRINTGAVHTYSGDISRYWPGYTRCEAADIILTPEVSESEMDDMWR